MSITEGLKAEIGIQGYYILQWEKSHKRGSPYSKICERALIIILVQNQLGERLRLWRALVVHCCNLSHDTLLFGQMKHWLLVPPLGHYNYTRAQETLVKQSQNSCSPKSIVGGSITQEDVVFSVFNLAIMFVLCTYSLLRVIFIVIVAVLRDWLLFWSFHFRNIGPVPVF